MNRIQLPVILLLATPSIGFGGTVSPKDGLTNAFEKIQPAADAFKAGMEACSNDPIIKQLAGKTFTFKFQPEGQGEPKSLIYTFSKCERKGHAVALVYVPVPKESGEPLEIWRGNQPYVDIFYGKSRDWVNNGWIAPEALLNGPVTFTVLRGEREDPDGDTDHYARAQATLTPK